MHRRKKNNQHISLSMIQINATMCLLRILVDILFYWSLWIVNRKLSEGKKWCNKAFCVRVCVLYAHAYSQHWYVNLSPMCDTQLCWEIHLKHTEYTPAHDNNLLLLCCNILLLLLCLLLHTNHMMMHVSMPLLTNKITNLFCMSEKWKKDT